MLIDMPGNSMALYKNISPVNVLDLTQYTIYFYVYILIW